MKLDEVVAGTVYIDTNVLYMHLRVDPAHSPVIKKFLGRIVRGEIEAFVGIPVLDELFYRLLLARIKDRTDHNPLDVPREDLTGAIRAHGKAIETAIRRLADLPHLNLVGVETDDLDQMLTNITRFSLLPRDALHLALIRRLDLAAVASDDTDFDRVEELDRHWTINPPETPSEEIA